MSLRKAIFVLIALSLSPLARGQDRARSWIILPGGANGGAITAQTTEADLIQAFGKSNVASKDIELGEGETQPGTELFPLDAVRRIDVLWEDTQGKRRPKRVQISGETNLWRTVHGISLGISLKRLEQLNRKPFLLAGFAFDYSGTVISWNHGALERELDHPGRVILRLMPSESASERSDARALQGDRKFSSGHPAMQKLNPPIYEVIWLFP